MSNYLPMKMVAKRLGIPEPELAVLLRLAGAPVRFVDGRVLVDDDAIEEFLEDLGVFIPNPSNEGSDDPDEDMGGTEG